MSQPLVSIIIPIYNADKYLQETVNSALNQTWQNIEIVLVDDGSTDHSLAIAKSFQSSRIKVIAQPNQGASAARNRAIQEAQGDFIQYLDADDLLNPTKIEDQITLLQRNELGILAACGTVHFFDGQDPNSGIHESGIPFIVDSDDSLEWLLKLLGSEDDNAGMVHPAAWLVPRCVADIAGLWDEQISLDDDGEYFARVVLESRGIRRSDTALSYYRRYRTRKSLSAGNSAHHYISALRSTDSKASQILRRTNSSKAYRVLARAYMSIAISSYPSYKQISDMALQKVAAMGGTNWLPTMGGKTTEFIKESCNWQTAKLINHYYHTLKNTLTKVIK